MDFEALATAFLKCSEKSSLSEKVTPNVFNEVTRGSPGTGGGMQGSTGDKRGLFTINSQDFETLSLRLLVEAHEDMESSSATTVCEWLAGDDQINIICIFKEQIDQIDWVQVRRINRECAWSNARALHYRSIDEGNEGNNIIEFCVMTTAC